MSETATEVKSPALRSAADIANEAMSEPAYPKPEVRKAKRFRQEPIGERIVIRPIENDNVSRGGIILPDKAIEKAMRGYVVAVGPGEYNPHTNEVRPMRLKVGNLVMYGKYSGQEYQLEGQSFVTMKEGEVLVVLHAEDLPSEEQLAELYPTGVPEGVEVVEPSTVEKTG